jgi:hypothetical protein
MADETARQALNAYLNDKRIIDIIKKKDFFEQFNSLSADALYVLIASQSALTGYLVRIFDKEARERIERYTNEDYKSYLDAARAQSHKTFLTDLYLVQMEALREKAKVESNVASAISANFRTLETAIRDVRDSLPEGDAATKTSIDELKSMMERMATASEDARTAAIAAAEAARASTTPTTSATSSAADPSATAAAIKYGFKVINNPNRIIQN